LSSDDYNPAPGEWVGGVLVNPNRSPTTTQYSTTPPSSQPQHYFHPESPTDVDSHNGTQTPVASQQRSGSVISWATTSRASSVGPIRSQRRSQRSQSQAPIRPGEDPLPPLSQQDVTREGFRFGAKTYFVTWSQVGDLPNSALEEKMASFGANIAGMSH
jgi:hypothetical protein